MTDLGRVFAMLDLIGQRAQDQSLDLRDGFLPGCTVSHGSSQRRNLSDPTPIVFFFDLHLHEKGLLVNRRAGKRVLRKIQLLGGRGYRRLNKPKSARPSAAPWRPCPRIAVWRPMDFARESFRGKVAGFFSLKANSTLGVHLLSIFQGHPTAKKCVGGSTIPFCLQRKETYAGLL